MDETRARFELREAVKDMLCECADEHLTALDALLAELAGCRDCAEQAEARVREEAEAKWSARRGRQKAEDALYAAEARETQLRQALDDASVVFAGTKWAEAYRALASPPGPPEDTNENRYAFYRAAWKDAETRADQHLDLALRNLSRAQAAEARADTQENA